MSNLQGQKHLIKCRCVLPQFKKMVNPLLHQFIVFSIIEDDNVKLKYSQCPNCGIVHRITEIGKSEIIQGREAMQSLITIDDIKSGLPENLRFILEKNNADLPTWEAVSFYYENKLWGNFVVLSSDTDSSVKQGKYVRLLGDSLFKVESYTREDVNL
jgi:hypothetical protein